MIISEYNSLYQLNWRGHIIMKSSSISSNWSGAFYCISFSVSFTVHSMEWRWFYCTNHVELVLITDTMKGYKIAFREPARCESQLFLLLLTDYEKQLERKWNQFLNIGNYVNVLDAKRLLLWSRWHSVYEHLAKFILILKEYQEMFSEENTLLNDKQLPRVSHICQL